MKVSFDFDGVLDRTDVQKYATELVGRGIDVHIVTTRWDRTSRLCDPEYFRWHGNRSWMEVHDMARQIGIPIRNCIFTNYNWKGAYFQQNPDFVWHLDDNQDEYGAIRRSGVLFISMWGSGWKHKCNKALQKKSLELIAQQSQDLGLYD